MAPAEARVGEAWVALDHLVAGSPDDLLGPSVVARFGHRLPFLVKLLAAARPLSLQVHPTMAQAREGYAREEAAAIPRRAAHRTYRDRNHKPELLVALTPFDVLSGFRSPGDAAVLVGALADAGAAPLRPWAERLHDGDLYGTFWGLWDLAPEACATVVSAAGRAGRRLSASTDGRWAREGSWTARLADQHPADPGVVVALLLNLLRLEPGQALHSPAGRLHAYLEGVGLEVMASSDNVIRGGLTAKHVDLAELEHVLVVQPEAVEPQNPVAEWGEAAYPTPTAEFRVSRIEPGDGSEHWVGGGPEVLVCLGGTVELAGVRLARGDAAFLPAAAGRHPVTPVGGAGGAGGTAEPASVWRVGIGSLDEHREPERRRQPRDR
jgi:mannose-6-phosphate isomerase